MIAVMQLRAVPLMVVLPVVRLAMLLRVELAMACGQAGGQAGIGFGALGVVGGAIIGGGIGYIAYRMAA